MYNAQRRAQYHRNRTKVLARMKAYRAIDQKRMSLQVRASQMKLHAAGKCVTCGTEHKRISQITKALALRCADCTQKQVDANRRRLQARKVAA